MRYQVDLLLPLKLQKISYYFVLCWKILLASQFAGFLIVDLFDLLILIPVVHFYIVLAFVEVVCSESFFRSIMFDLIPYAFGIFVYKDFTCREKLMKKKPPFCLYIYIIYIYKEPTLYSYSNFIVCPVFDFISAIAFVSRHVYFN